MSCPGPDPNFAVSVPAAPLRSYIAHYVGFRAHGLIPATHSGLPSHHIGLAISLADPIEIVRMPCAPGSATLQAFVSGLQVRPSTVGYATHRDGLFIHFTPLGVQAVLGVASIELASRLVDFEGIWGRAAADLVARLADIPTWAGRFAVLNQVFLNKLRPVIPACEVTWAWRRLADEQGCITVHQLATETGWTRQHLTEQFHRAVGVPPKTAARIFRFERSFRMVKNRRCALAQIAAECGYHNQAHMILEWKSLAGCTPTAWISEELPFFQYTEPSASDDWL